MTATQILIPQQHDSFSEITLNGESLLIRFTYNDTFDQWSFGLYELNQTPILVGVKIAPNFPLNLFTPMRRLGDVYFIAMSKRPHIGRRDLWDGGAEFLIMEKSP